MTSKLAFYLYFFFLIPIFGELKAQCSRSIDSLVLVDIFNNCGGNNWGNKLNWLVPGRPISMWYGVILSNEGCVESIVLSNNKLEGLLPDNIGDLKGLKKLNLSNNQLSGTLPNSITQLNALEELNLSSNLLEGQLPNGIGNLSNLRKLQLGINMFSGNLPNSLSNLTQLSILHLHQNFLNGLLRPQLGNLINLEELLLSQNRFVGSIPTQFGNLLKLRSLVMSQNMLSGTIPSSLGNLTNLSSLFADENQLTGEIPITFGNLTNLREVWLNKNTLTGSIPDNITNLSKLQKLLLNDNLLSGNLPIDIGNLSELISLHVSDNNISGNIPTSLGNLSKLLSLLVGNNELTGTIPESFTNLRSLVNLDMHNNQLSGPFPESFGDLSNLRRIYFQNNNLEGCFPESMQKFCFLAESENVSSLGYNFKGNSDLIWAGDFGRWCSGDGRVMEEIISNSPLCEGSDLDLSVGGGISFQWSGPLAFSAVDSTTQVPDISTDAFGEYSVVVVNRYLCRDTLSTLVEPIGNASVTSNSPICEGENIVLNASGGISYIWSGPNGFSSILPNPQIDAALPNMAGTYTVEITTEDCIIKKEIEVTFNISGTISSNSPVCEGSQILLSVDGGISYTWSGPNGFTSNELAPQITSSTSNNQGIYSVTVIGNDNCVYTLNTQVEITKKRILDFSGFDNVCTNSDPILLPNNIENTQGLWTGEGVVGSIGNQQFFIDSLVGRQTLTFIPTADSSCLAEITTTIDITSLNLMAIEAAPSLNDEDSNGSISLIIDKGTQNVDITYTGPENGNLLNITSESVVIDDLKSGEYLFSAVDQNGCFDSVSVSVRYLRPSYFLPNIVNASSLSENGRFYVKGTNIYSYDLEIYNRWGGILFSGENLQANDINQSWNPSESGVLSGVYIFIVKLKTELGVEIIPGTITVI